MTIDCVEQFRAAIEQAGLTPPATIIPDGKIHRFPTNDTRGDDSGYYVVHADEIPAGCFGDWRSGLKQTWCAKSDRQMTTAERTAYQQRIEKIQREREEEDTQRHEAAAEQAESIWMEEGRRVSADHPYLTHKQVKAHGDLRMHLDRRLIVPLRNLRGQIRSIQFIPPEPKGKKLFLKDSAVTGAFFIFGEEDADVSRLAIVEGYATGASIREATGFPVFAALSAANMEASAHLIRNMFPSATILVCGDHDKSGAGQKAARAAAAAINGLVVIPEIEGDDWNDVHVRDGLNAVKSAVEAALTQREIAMMTTIEAQHQIETPAEAWPTLDEAAFIGLPGSFVKAVEPYSEADPVGLLLHCLISAGVMIGSGPRVLVEHLPHCARTNALLVGMTAGGRKGTAWSPVRYLLTHSDESFVLKRVKSGLSSGEGLIFQVRDPQYDQEPIREGGRKTGEIIGYQDVMSDAGESDKRLLILESEFASALTVMEREGNTLSPVLRDVWDHGNLSPLTKKDRMVATGAHVGIIGHITTYELLRKLTATERANGVANRFLIALVRQSKFLPSGKGTPPEVMSPYFVRFLRTVERARTRGALLRDGDCEDLWASVYRRLVEVPPGLTGSILARGAAQVLRLSLIYALLDEAEAQRGDTAIRIPHLMAAIAVWDYCTASAYQIFGDAIGDPVADRFLRLIKTGPQTDTELYEAMGKHDGDRSRKDQALELLQRLDRIHSIGVKTAGRSITEWHIGVSSKCALCAKRGERVG